MVARVLLKLLVEGPEADASSSTEMGLCNSSTGTSDSLEWPMVAVAMRAGPTSAKGSSGITELTACCWWNKAKRVTLTLLQFHSLLKAARKRGKGRHTERGKKG